MRRSLALFGALLVCASTLVAPTASATGATINWETCTDLTLAAAGAECARLSVPLDYAAPTGRQVQIAVSRVRHKVSEDKYQGVLITVPGGPGSPGLPFTILGAKVPAQASEAYDWVSFDPRGVGASTPSLSCDPAYMDYNRPNYVPKTAELEQAWLARVRKYAADCGAKNDPALLANIKTADTARDIDSLRSALGAQQVTLYGISYGTYVSQVYATLFPARIRRMVLDSAVDPRYVFYQVNLNQDVAMNRNLTAWMKWVAEHDSEYHLGTSEAQVRSLITAELQRLAASPVGGVIGPDELTDSFVPAMYSQASWIGLADAFTKLLNGDFSAVKSLFEGVMGRGNDNGYAVYLATQCTDVQWPTNWTQWSNDAWQAYLQAPEFTWMNTWYNAPCIAWPAKAGTPVNVDGQNVSSALMIDETLDGAEPFTGSLEVRKRFPGASLIAIPGGTSHAATLSGNICVDSQIATYLLSGGLPARKPGNGPDTTCAPPLLPGS